MTVFVAFDGSPLAEAALKRAVDISYPGGTDVVVMAVVPAGNEQYATERGWLAEDEPFDWETVTGRLRERALAIAPEATFRVERVDRYAPPGTITLEIRQAVRAVDPRLVVVGSENAGRLVTSLSSVSGGVVADTHYDVLIVRHPDV